MLKKILLILLLALIVIQFFRPEKNISEAPQTQNIANAYTVPADVDSILSMACNDCHSNNTKYPWYNRVQPVAWWLADHVDEGKSHLNFDSFLSYEPRKQDHKMEEVVEMVEDGHMPLNSYTWIHRDAKLNEQQKKKLIDWAVAVRQEISAKTGFTPPNK